ncbi:O-antigen ligase family protein [bacterium]|nr:O-antigen ligase family protein [bacterium]
MASSSDITSLAVDPSRRTYGATALLVGLILAWSHWQPGQAYPLQGMWQAIALTLASALALALAVASRVPLTGLAGPGGMLLLCAGWGWVRTAFSPVPAGGAPEVGTLVLAGAAFWIGAFLARAGATLFPERRQVGLWLVVCFFCSLTVVFSLHAILEYHVLYPRQLAELRRSGLLDEGNQIAESIAHALEIRRVSSRFGNPNVLAGFLGACLPLLAAVFAGTRGKKGLRIASGAGIAAVLYAVWRTGSAGGMIVTGLGAAGIVAIAALSWPRKNSGKTFLLSVAISALILLFHFAPSPQASVFAETQTVPVVSPDDSSTPRQARTIMQRVYYGRSGLAMWRDAPLWGHGLGGYERLYSRYRLFGADETAFAHNYPLQVLVESGLLGLGLFLGFLFLLAKRLWDGLQRGTISTLHLGLGGVLVLLFVDGLGEYILSVREVLLDFCLLAGALCAAGNNRNVTHSPTTVQPERKILRSRRSLAVWILSLAVSACALALVIVPDQMGSLYAQRTRDTWDTMEQLTPGSRRTPELARESLRLADRAVSWQPENPRLLQLRAYAWHVVDRPDKMQSDLIHAARLHPDSASIRADLARVAWRGGQRDEALRRIDEAIARHPLKSTYHEQKARHLATMGRREEALQEAGQAVKLAFKSLEKQSSRETWREIAKTGDGK